MVTEIMKIIFISNQARASFIFWSVLMRSMLERGYEVICLVPDGDTSIYIEKLEKIGVRVLCYELDRKGINPIADLRSIWQLYKVLRKENPHRIFTSTIKPTIYGNIAAKFAKNSYVISCITGLGFSFEQSTKLGKKMLHYMVKNLYKFSLSFAKCVIFQNEDDKKIFLQQAIIKNDKETMLCNGTGVDLEHFYWEKNLPTNPTFLLMGRLLKAKGIDDFVKAAKMLKQKYPKACFQILGPSEQGFGAYDIKKLLSAQEYVNYLGEAEDVRLHIKKASVLVLPSWREGLSCALMEGMSMGRPIVASDVPGCKELVQEGINGFLVPVRDAHALANAMEHFIVKPQCIEEMGLRSRIMVEEHFDARHVAAQIMQCM